METLLAKTANAVRTSSHPNIDGILNDKVWDISIPISDLIQFEPDNLAPSTENTEVRILYDLSLIHI